MLPHLNIGIYAKNMRTLKTICEDRIIMLCVMIIVVIMSPSIR